LTHEEFIRAYNNGEVIAHVNKNMALRLIGNPLVSKGYRAAHALWMMVWILTFPAAIICFVLVKWWVGLIILFFSLLLAKAMRESACRSVIEEALVNESFYNFALESQGLIVEKKRGIR